MTDLDLTKLREIAVAATDGPWNLHTLRTDETHDIRGSIDDEANIVIYAECEDADADHIATFDPPTVLALVDEVERLRAGIIEAHETITNEAGPAWLAASKVLEDALDVYVRIPVENARLCDFAEMIEQRQVQLEQDRARLNALSKALAHLRMIAGADDDSRIGDLLALDLIGGAA